MWVVKLGGSLAHSDELEPWLRAIAQSGAGRVVVVPGGGPFADAVRDEQAIRGFSNQCAHHLALLAMVQYGLMLCDIQADFHAIQEITAFPTAMRKNQIAVWTGVDRLVTDPSIEASWDVTSDSLALWLAQKIGATGTLLVKTVAPPTLDLRQLVADEYLDGAALIYAQRSVGPLYCATATQSSQFAPWLANNGLHYAQIHW